jgi:hypothetical protein
MVINRMNVLRGLILLIAALSQRPMHAEEAVYSGPQVGEKLVPFNVRGVFDRDAGQSFDFVKMANHGPIVMVFVHEVNRPSIGLTRALTSYTASRAKDGLFTGVIHLHDDATEAENMLKRMRHALTPGVPTGISVDGIEGPGSYGLNRKVTLTILVGKNDQVTANFALIQPSLQADLPKVLDAIVKLIGGPVPSIEELAGSSGMAPMRGKENQSASNEDLRALLAPLIRRDAKPDEVEAAARKIDSYLEKNESARAEVGRIAARIIDADKLASYGTPRAQEIIREWKVKYGSNER